MALRGRRVRQRRAGRVRAPVRPRSRRRPRPPGLGRPLPQARLRRGLRPGGGREATLSRPPPPGSPRRDRRRPQAREGLSYRPRPRRTGPAARGRTRAGARNGRLHGLAPRRARRAGLGHRPRGLRLGLRPGAGAPAAGDSPGTRERPLRGPLAPGLREAASRAHLRGVPAARGAEVEPRRDLRDVLRPPLHPRLRGDRPRSLYRRGRSSGRPRSRPRSRTPHSPTTCRPCTGSTTRRSPACSRSRTPTPGRRSLAR